MRCCLLLAPNYKPFPLSLDSFPLWLVSALPHLSCWCFSSQLALELLYSLGIKSTNADAFVLNTDASAFVGVKAFSGCLHMNMVTMVARTGYECVCLVQYSNNGILNASRSKDAIHQNKVSHLCLPIGLRWSCWVILCLVLWLKCLQAWLTS